MFSYTLPHHSGANKKIRLGFHHIALVIGQDSPFLLLLCNSLSPCAPNVPPCDREREPNPDTRALELIPPPSCCKRTKRQARHDHAARGALRLFTQHVTNLLHLADAPPTPNFALRLRTRALTTTGTGLYTHQASATASTSLCVVLPLIP
jgi:hypothetical protein